MKFTNTFNIRICMLSITDISVPNHILTQQKIVVETPTTEKVNHWELILHSAYSYRKNIVLQNS